MIVAAWDARDVKRRGHDSEIQRFPIAEGDCRQNLSDNVRVVFDCHPHYITDRQL